MLDLPSVTREGSINDEVVAGRGAPEKIVATLSLNDSGTNFGLIDLNLLIVFDALMGSGANGAPQSDRLAC
jgi:hypothetical protein